MVTRVEARIYCPDCRSDLTGYFTELFAESFNQSSDSDTDYISSSPEQSESESSRSSPIIDDNLDNLDPILDPSTDLKQTTLCQQEPTKKGPLQRSTTLHAGQLEKRSQSRKRVRTNRPVFIGPEVSMEEAGASKRKQ